MRSLRELLPVLVGGGLLASCAGPPSLETFPGHVPEVADLTAHIQCELLPLVASINQPDKHHKELWVTPVDIDGATTIDTSNALLQRLVIDHPRLMQLLPFLVKYNFVASSSLVLDVTDTGGFSPSLSFIAPFNSTGSFNRTLSIGASLSGMREHTGTYAYTVNFAQLWDRRAIAYVDCNKSSGFGGIDGDLDLITDITQGLLSIDIVASTNISASATPVLPSSNILIDKGSPLKLQLTDTDADSLLLGLYGGLTVVAPTTGYQGTITFTGIVTANDNNDGVSTLGFGKNQFKYYMSLTGSTFQNIDGDKADKYRVRFSMAGNLTQARPAEYKSELGFAPKLTLYGHIDLSSHPYKMYVESALLSSDAASGGGRIATASAEPTPTPTPTPTNTPVTTPPPVPINMQLGQAASPGVFQPRTGSGTSGAGTSGKGAPGGPSSSGSATQFSTFENFQITYGLNGGPNWTLVNFKGPGSGTGGGGSGGSGGSGGLLSISRADTDNISITFVAACQQGGQNMLEAPQTYWDTIPVCDPSGTLLNLAGIAGQSTNFYRTNH
jgi:hypothetical protein